jgi:Na+/phosphate symporter
MRASIVLVVLGSAAGLLGAALLAAPGGPDYGSATGLGSFLLGVGGVLFVIGLLVEFFSIGSHLSAIRASLAPSIPPPAAPAPMPLRDQTPQP